MREETKIKIQLARIIQDKMSSSYKRIVEFYQDDIQVIDWLIEQAEKVSRLELEIEYWKSLWEQAVNEKAEKVEQLQQEQKRLRDQIYETVEEKFLLERQLQQAQAKAERYEKALREIVNSLGWREIKAEEIAKRALEGTE
ncbi:hypothetical protein [Thermaerobacillus caldiproteolyticus]|uniref:hypothetical protein n=1 Tax=Thermaerobacillus caldiproteolyticus TaxID=247480 RepID=UPI0018F16B30|nr:hypothetical protein [Anoxybacillus caldiproteolyticus]